ncbi:MAG: hypothetical protein K2K55_09760 [Duncaniella sp.]|nr:hypothetical protein [Duncaniella sp.]
MPQQASAQTEFRRDLEQITFIPRGQWITGVSVSYSQTDMKDYQFLIIENIKGDTYNFKVSPMLFYAFKDNLALGGRFAYQRSRTSLNSADVVLDSETSYSGGPMFALSHSYYTTGAFRNYISLGHSMRFGFFNEVQLQIGGGQSKIINGDGDDLTGTYARTFGLSVGLTPGVIMFLNNYSALEVSVGVLGFNYTNTRSITDQIYVANTDVRSANFRINLFSISFGVAFYL